MLATIIEGSSIVLDTIERSSLVLRSVLRSELAESDTKEIYKDKDIIKTLEVSY